MGRLKLFVLLFATASTAIWLWLARYHMLDDALIHLRYAQMLAGHHFFTFDGEHPSYGCTSPLFVAGLAGLTYLTHSDLLPSFTSWGIYLALLGLIAVKFYRSRGVTQILWMFLLLINTMPMAVRWLANGMETGLVLIAVTVLVLSPDRSEKTSRLRPITLGLLGLVFLLLRVDLSMLIAFTCAAGMVFELERGDTTRIALRETLLRYFPLTVGALVGMLILRLIFGHVMPDTAIAKHGAPISFFSATNRIFQSTMSSLGFGTGMILLWLTTLVLTLKLAPKHWRSTILANLALPVLIQLIAMRGQIIEGIRHVVWIYWFMIQWNLRTIDWAPKPAARQIDAGSYSRFAFGAVAVALIAAAIGYAVEIEPASRIFAGGRKLFLDMRRDELGSTLHGHVGVGYDIGFISHFSEGKIIDILGLVDGREFASLTIRGRQDYAASQSPEFLYLAQWQANNIRDVINPRDYVICRRYQIMNVRAKLYYYLAAKPELAEKLGADPSLSWDAVLQ